MEGWKLAVDYGVRVTASPRGAMARTPEVRESRSCWIDADLPTVPPTAFPRDFPVHKGKEGVITALAYVRARPDLGAALPDQHAACGHDLSREPLDAEALTLAVPPVAGRAHTFLVGHDLPPPLLSIADCELNCSSSIYNPQFAILGFNLVYPQCCKVLPMSSLAPIVDLGFVLHDDDLLCLAVPHHRRRDAGALHNRRADFRRAPVGNQEDFVEGHGGSRFGLQPLHLQRPSLFDSVLLAACLDDRVHVSPRQRPSD